MSHSAFTSSRAGRRSANLYQRALTKARAGRHASALAMFDELLASNPTHAEALNDSAVALMHLGRTDEAVGRFQRAVAAAPAFAAAHHNLGMLLHNLGRFQEASAAFARSLALHATDAGWWMDAGNAYLESLDPQNALAAYDEALRLDTRCINAMANRALALRALKRTLEAEIACRAVIALAPMHAEAWSNLGLMLKETNRIDEAADALEKARALAPHSTVVGANLCTLHVRCGRRNDALALAQSLVHEHPESAEAWNALGHSQLEWGLFDDAMTSCNRALAIAPTNAMAAFNKAVLLLQIGDYAHGLELYEARRAITVQRAGILKHSGREWDGSVLHGETVLLTEEQGAGDVLQFVRYAALLKERGARRVLVATQDALAGIVATAPGVDSVVSLDGHLPAFDLHVPLLSLPRLFGTRVDSIPGIVPYLLAPDRPIARRIAAAEGVRVGIAWSGNPLHQRDHLRSIQFSELLAAVQMPGVSLFSLQKGAPRSLEASLSDSIGVVDLEADLPSFDDTAAAIAALDVIISVDTSVCHLAGALGKTTWLLLPMVADWRWLRDRQDSPWYPTMRLFRQTSLDDWSAPLGIVRNELALLAGCHPPTDATELPVAAPLRKKTTRTTTAPAVNGITEAPPVSRWHVAGPSGDVLAAYEVALAAEPTHAEALNNSGVLLAQAGYPVEGERRVREALTQRPDYGQAYYNLALLLLARGIPDEALAAFEQAVKHEVQHARWWTDYAGCAAALMKHETALCAFDRALALEPDNASLHADRAISLRGLLRQEDAIAECRESIRLDPHNPAARSNLGVFLKEMRRWEEAESALLDGLSEFPEHPLLLTNLSTLYLEWGLVDDALTTAERVIAAHPQHPEGYNSRGCALIELGKLPAAREEFLRALSLDSRNGNAEWNLAFLSLVEGDLHTGLRAFERRRTLNGLIVQSRELPGEEWDGSPLRGRTVFVHEEQGIGDVIQFVRYASELKARGAGRVIVETSADAAALVATAPGVSEVTLRGAPIPAYDLYVPLMSLPYRCDTRMDTIPASVPYLRARPRPAADVVRTAPGRLKVGIVWGGNPRNQRDKYRSVPFPALLATVQLDGISLFSLQKGPHAEALRPWQAVANIVDLDPHLETLEDTAAAIGELNLVITICTSVAHLAGALNQRTWTLLAHVADWRWFRDRDDTPWYPSMRLFRQPSPGTWSRPLGQVRAALQELLDQNTPLPR